MNCKMSVFAILASALISITVLAQESPLGDPLGEKAHYKLDKDSSRTSSKIKSGTMDLEVTKYLPNANPPSYEVTQKYKFQVILLGTKNGSQTLIEPEEVFKESFLVKLRETKKYEAPNFKMKHLGFRNATNMDKKKYTNCDYVLLYDFVEPDGVLQNFAAEMLLAAAQGYGISWAKRSDIEDLKIWAHVKWGVPVIGAVKIDMEGVVSGFDIKAGVDFSPKGKEK